jgi:ferrochelatase
MMDVRVYVAMRYWNPMTESAVEQVVGDGIKRIVLLPLYPQYSMATTGSSVNEWNRVVARRGMNGMQVNLIEEYCDHPMYIASLVDRISIALGRLPSEDRKEIHLLLVRMAPRSRSSGRGIRTRHT